MEGFELITNIKKLSADLTKSIAVLKQNGVALAEAEKNYKIKLRQHALILKDEKLPATLIDKVVYGIVEVAELRFKRDEAQVIYDTNRDHLNVVKLQLRVLESQYRTEFGATGHGC